MSEADEARRRKVADSVQSMEERASKNPLYMWWAIDLCIKCNIPFPPWVMGYLKESASKLMQMMFDAAPTGTPEVAREAEAVGRALGFGAKGRGRGNVFSTHAKYWRDTHVLMAVLNRIVQGEEPGERLYANVVEDLRSMGNSMLLATPEAVRKIFLNHRRDRTELYRKAEKAFSIESLND